MSVIDQEEKKSALKKMNNPTSQELRSLVKGGVKNLKTQWIQAAQTMYSIHRDKLFEYWGYEKFDHYVKAELGIKKALAMKMIKTYIFLENYEPHVLKPEFYVLLDTDKIPDMEVISVLRMIRFRDKITKDEYQYLRRIVFEKAVSASDLRLAFKNIMDKKKDENPEEVREAEKKKTIKQLNSLLSLFKIRAKNLRWCKEEIIKKAEDLYNALRNED
jgi:hypothetical protein